DGASPPRSRLRVAAVARRRPRVAAIAALTDPFALRLEFLLRGGSVSLPRTILRRLGRRGARRRQRTEPRLSDLSPPCRRSCCSNSVSPRHTVYCRPLSVRISCGAPKRAIPHSSASITRELFWCRCSAQPVTNRE